MRSGVSKVDPALAGRSIRELKPYLEAYNYNDRQMANFVIRNSNHIFRLLPGYGSTHHAKRFEEYRQLMQDAVQIKSGNQKLQFNGLARSQV